ncbi:unnamed protein product [Ambrosiozyma monospora]|uniref:Unnamed protein product n=1 Tax=Ambrosiozyma monospora TaxID=43982 RepID=A0ACB5TWJ2_AMBMO|nr:unnamed protein product [Ambrosiozyma monospora]
MTPALKQHLTVLQNRQYIDPKRFYKKQKWTAPERFQVGEIISGSFDGSKSKMKRRSKGGELGMLGELMNDKEAKGWFKKRYSEIQTQKASGGKKAYLAKSAKRMKR